MQGVPKAASGSRCDTVARFRLERRKRLLAKPQFDRVFNAPDINVRREGIRAVATRNDCNCCRLGLVVSRRAVPKSVDRNLAKRLIRESFRGFQHRLPAVDVVVVVRRSDPSGARDTLREELGRTLSRVWQEIERGMGRDR